MDSLTERLAPLPAFIMPVSLADMTTQQIDEHLEGVRERRLRGVRIYEDVLAEKERIMAETNGAKLLRELGALKSQLDRLGEALERTDKRLNNIRRLRLELGLE